MNNAQLKKILLGTPYFLWSLIFILIPLGMVFYYGLTDRSGAFTLNNIISITTAEHAKALWLALPDCNCFMPPACLSACHDSLQYGREPAQLYHINFHSSHVDEFPAAYHGMADTSRKNRCH